MECSHRIQPMLPRLEHEGRRKAELQTGENGALAYYNIRYAYVGQNAGGLRKFSTLSQIFEHLHAII